VSEADQNLVSSDYPGQVCRRLEEQGVDPIFLSSALGGVSILFPEFRMDLERHLELVSGLVCSGRARALEKPSKAASVQLRCDVLRIAKPEHRCRIFSPLGPPASLLDSVLGRLLERLARSFSEVIPLEDGIPIHLMSLGDVLLVGTPFDLGVTVAKELRYAAMSAGYRQCIPVSQVNAYAGYVHSGWVYREVPEKGYRFMALYENSLAPFGFDLGDRIVREVKARLGQGA
jgi:hypothetical protein